MYNLEPRIMMVLSHQPVTKYNIGRIDLSVMSVSDGSSTSVLLFPLG